MNKTSSVLDLLGEGAKIVFPDGCALVGNPAERFIEVHHETRRYGNRALDEDGLEYALGDIEKLRRKAVKSAAGVPLCKNHRYYSCIICGPEDGGIGPLT